MGDFQCEIGIENLHRKRILYGELPFQIRPTVLDHPGGVRIGQALEGRVLIIQPGPLVLAEERIDKVDIQEHISL